MTNELQTLDISEAIEAVVIGGDLSKLSPADRVNYYKAVCQSIGLNPLTRPFDYITLNRKLTLYARKDAADQLRRNNGISIGKPEIQFEDEWIIVTVVANDQHGRTDSDVGVVNKKDMQGNFGNALMKAVTKAKRRVTLSICGLGMLDETEVETIPNVEIVKADVTEPQPSNKPTSNDDRPYSPETIREKLPSFAANYSDFEPTAKQRSLLHYGLELCFAGDKEAEDKLHTVLFYLTGLASIKDVSGPEMKAILENWLNIDKDDTGDYSIDPMAANEAQAIFTEALANEGQKELL